MHFPQIKIGLKVIFTEQSKIATPILLNTINTINNNNTINKCIKKCLFQTAFILKYFILIFSNK